ncbi:MAG: hypothetical protein D8M58_22075 [Calditrichaeota bacterium]|nr:MAG: hypothetical protein DWQ03_08630 [Calditrichota bacterium]MBL1208101.1 hypothetical protein [Calditrichota bacterium]NOG47939.1 hypothetical protein [Calditrichota bacterium]
MRNTLIIIFSISILIFISCSSPNEETDMSFNKIIKGTVSDSISTMPIDSVEIILKSLTSSAYSHGPVYTDSSGKYRIDVGSGSGQDLYLHFLKMGYHAKQLFISQFLLNKDSTILNIRMIKK